MHIALIGLLVVGAVLGIITVTSQNIQLESEVNEAIIETMEKEEERQEELLKGYINKNGSITIRNMGFEPVKIMMYGLNNTENSANVLFTSASNSGDITLPDDTTILPKENAQTIEPGGKLTFNPKEPIDVNEDTVGYIVSDLARKYPLENVLANEGDGKDKGDGLGEYDEINLNTGNQTGNGLNPEEIGLAMINGMGLQSRIIQEEYEGRITHGTGVVGTDVSLVPYLPVPSNTKFTSAVIEGDMKQTMDIPNFYNAYQYASGDFHLNKGWITVVSTQKIENGDGYVEVVLGETTNEKIVSIGFKDTVYKAVGEHSYGLIVGSAINFHDRESDEIVEICGHGSRYPTIGECVYAHGKTFSYFDPLIPTPGTKIKMQVESGHVKYYVNGDLRYTSPTPVESSHYPLHVEMQLKGKTTSVSDIKIFDGLNLENVIWDKIKSQKFQNPKLVNKGPSETNTIGYHQQNANSEGITASQDGTGIHVSGTGTKIFKINPFESDSIIFRVNMEKNTDASVKLVQSKNDLVQVPYNGEQFIFFDGDFSSPLTSKKSLFYIGSYCRTQGSLISDTWPNQLLNFKRYGCGYTAYGYMFNAGTASMTFGDVYLKNPEESISCSMTSSVRYGVYSGSFGYGYKNYKVSGEPGIITTEVENDYHRLDRIYKSAFRISPEGVTGTGYAPVRMNCDVREAAPYNSLEDTTTNINVSTKSIGEDDLYLIVESDGGKVDITGGSAEGSNFIDIDRLPQNTPYQITVTENGEEYVIITGMTDHTGQVIINEFEGAPKIAGGKLHIYQNSLAYRGSFSTVVLDELNGETIHIPTTDDKIYLVHAYAKIPISGGDITITETYLNEDVPIPYINKNYRLGQEINIPIIPGYDTINMVINGIPASLKYGDILGGTGIKIADPVTSTITKRDLNNYIPTMSATAGTSTYAIATNDGSINAITTMTFSGSVSITNRYQITDPPPPPPPPRRDPLEGYVKIFVNGEQYGDKIKLGKNPYTPGGANTSTIQGNNIVDKAVYSYPDYTLTGAHRVNVNAGDFVEFYIYGTVEGDIRKYEPPTDRTIISESGSASATVNIRSAHITTSSN